jgi:hypothetical protein
MTLWGEEARNIPVGAPLATSRNHVVPSKRRPNRAAKTGRVSDTRSNRRARRRERSLLREVVDFVVNVCTRCLDGLVLKCVFAGDARHLAGKGVLRRNGIPSKVHNQADPRSARQSRGVNAMLLVDGRFSHRGRTSSFAPGFARSREHTAVKFDRRPTVLAGRRGDFAGWPLGIIFVLAPASKQA